MENLILVVEDNTEWRNIHKRILGQAGFHCIFASDYTEAIERLRQEPLVMVQDLELGDEDFKKENWRGWDLASRAILNGISMIIVTGHDEGDNYRRAFKDFKVVNFFDKGSFLENEVSFINSVNEALDKAKAIKKNKAPNLIDQVDFLIITALEEERDSVLNLLPKFSQIPPDADDINVYFESELRTVFPDKTDGKYKLIITTPLKMGRVDAALATIFALNHWLPRHIILVGIAGGISEKNVRLGDVLVSDQIVDYAMQKWTNQGPDVRWQAYPADARLHQAAKGYRDNRWYTRLGARRPDSDKPKRHIGPIASGDIKIASSQLMNQYREHWSTLIGVEMEAAGVAAAAFKRNDPKGILMIKGVCDLADEMIGTPDIEKWRPYACDIAASYTIGLLRHGPITINSK